MAEAQITLIRDLYRDMMEPTKVTDKEIQYRIGGVGPFSLFMATAEYTPEKAKAAIQAKVHEWSQIVGSTVKG